VISVIFSLKGKIIVSDNIDHEKFIIQLYQLLEKNDWYFKGETRQIAEKGNENERD
jgi:hypothetical protein